jgi:hypothetical protein
VASKPAALGMKRRSAAIDVVIARAARGKCELAQAKAGPG